MNPNQQFNNFNMTPEQFMFQQRYMQQQQQGQVMPTGMQGGMPGATAGGGLNVMGNPAGMAPNTANNNDWRNGQNDTLRREMMQMLMNTLRETAGSNLPIEKIHNAVTQAEKNHWDHAASLEDYKNRVITQCNNVKNQLLKGAASQNQAMLLRQQQLMQQSQRQGQMQQGQVPGNLLNMGNQMMNQMRPQQQNINPNQVNNNNNPNNFNMNSNLNQQQQNILLAQQMLQQQQQFRPTSSATGNMTIQQQQQYKLHMLEASFSRLKTGIIIDPAVESRFKQFMNMMNGKRAKSEQISVVDAEKKLIKDLTISFFKNIVASFDHALYLVFSGNPSDPKLEQALKNKWLIMDQLSNIDKDIFYINRESASKLMADLKTIVAQATLNHPIYSNMNPVGGGPNAVSPFASGGPKTPSLKGDGSGAGTPEKIATTPPFSSFPLQPAIKKEDVQVILNRDFGKRPVSEMEYSEIIALERSLYPGLALKESELGQSFSFGAADIAELDASYLFGDSKLIDPNQPKIPSSSFATRWSSIVSQRENAASIPAFEEEVRLAAAVHQVIHNIQFLLNEEVSILFHDGADDSNNSKKVLALSIPNLAKYQQLQASLLAGHGVTSSGSISGSASIISIDLMDGFDASVTEMLQSLLKQGANIKTCLELLWPIKL